VKKTLLLAALAFSSLAVGAQQVGTGSTPMLWRDPVSIETRDLYWGSGAEARMPQPPFKFVEEKLTGTVAKVVVTDRRGDTWDVKLAGEESHPEVAANRLLWALGYGAQEMYFVHEGRIEGATGLKRARDFLKPDGSFVAARFRRRDPAVAEGEGWAFAKNPFVGRQELSGLIILMALINNWDTEEAKNQETVTVKTRDGAIEQWFRAKDLGASDGSWVRKERQASGTSRRTRGMDWWPAYKATRSFSTIRRMARPRPGFRSIMRAGLRI
jgi:hypothetical protein